MSTSPVAHAPCPPTGFGVCARLAQPRGERPVPPGRGDAGFEGGWDETAHEAGSRLLARTV